MLNGLQRSFSQRTDIAVSVGGALVSRIARDALDSQPGHRYTSSKKSTFDKKPMTQEEYVNSHMPSFDEFCQKIALPTIQESGVNPQRAKELSDPANLQRAYECYCGGSYRGYIDSLDPMNPFIL